MGVKRTASLALAAISVLSLGVASATAAPSAKGAKGGTIVVEMSSDAEAQTSSGAAR